jgi:OH-DDVA meta-cleavage compound hydrolase
MIIDCHAHTTAPAELWAYKASQLAARGSHGRGSVDVSDDELREALMTGGIGGHGHLPTLDKIGTNLQLLSPRPFHMMHSEKPAKIVHWFTEEVNDVIHRQCKLFPDRFAGIAGLPQVAGRPIEESLPELERAVKQLGFKGCLLNPDPYENGGTEPPALGERYWYPLYEKLCELDIPAHIHATGSRSERVSYSIHFINEETIAVLGLLNSDVFTDFPNLKVIVSHGGGAIPYQLGRWDARFIRRKKRLKDELRKLYFDTVLYTKDALELLVKTVGPDRCLFGAECPGVASILDPETGRHLDDIKPHFESIEWLTDAQRKMIYEDNARQLFKL